jgi:hypothetical protein
VTNQNTMTDRALKIYGIGVKGSRAPATGVLIWLLLALAFWFISAVEYLGPMHSISYPTFVIAAVFTACFVLVYRRWKRIGLNC